MIGSLANVPGQLERELAYYHRECNDLGARLLRLQEEQSAAFREARRSRMVAKLIREAYRIADAGSSPDAIGSPMLGVIVENVMCDGAAFLAEVQPGCGHFSITHAVGVPRRPAAETVLISDPPACFFTTSRSTLQPPAYELTSLLHLPYILWCYDRTSGHALILGNRSESNVSRAFESGDQELIEGALSVYLDIRGRKQAEFDLRQAKVNLERANGVKTVFLDAICERLAGPLDAITGCSGRLLQNDYADLSGTERDRCVSELVDAGEQLRSLVNTLRVQDGVAQGGPAAAMASLPRAAAADAAGHARTGPGAGRRTGPAGDVDRYGQVDRLR